jgi:hypothetical protein
MLFLRDASVREKRTEALQMQNKDKHSKRIYDKITRTWFEVSEEKYREYDRWRTALRKRMQYHGECSCTRNKWWLCDGVCQDCEFHNHTTISLDEPLPDGNGTRGDYIQDDNPTPEELMADRDLLEYLIMRLRETDPDANRIIRLLQDGISDRKIAETLGRKQRTFSKELKDFRDMYRRLLDN